jgi:hypothetical protein
MNLPLNSRQRRFVEEYLVDGNATAACRRAGYRHLNADVTGPRLRRRPPVAAAIAAALRQADLRLLARLADTARRDPPGVVRGHLLRRHHGAVAMEATVMVSTPDDPGAATA